MRRLLSPCPQNLFCHLQGTKQAWTAGVLHHPRKRKTDFKVPCVEAPRVCLARAWQCFLSLLCQHCCVSLPALSPANAGHPASSTPSLRTTLLCLKEPGAQPINTQLLFPPTLLCGSLSEKIGSCQHRLQLGQGSIFLQLRFEPQPHLYGKK